MTALITAVALLLFSCSGGPAREEAGAEAGPEAGAVAKRPFQPDSVLRIGASGNSPGLSFLSWDTEGGEKVRDEPAQGGERGQVIANCRGSRDIGPARVADRKRQRACVDHLRARCRADRHSCPSRARKRQPPSRHLPLRPQGHLDHRPPGRMARRRDLPPARGRQRARLGPDAAYGSEGAAHRRPPRRQPLREGRRSDPRIPSRLHCRAGLPHPQAAPSACARRPVRRLAAALARRPTRLAQRPPALLPLGRTGQALQRASRHPRQQCHQRSGQRLDLVLRRPGLLHARDRPGHFGDASRPTHDRLLARQAHAPRCRRPPDRRDHRLLGLRRFSRRRGLAAHRRLGLRRINRRPRLAPPPHRAPRARGQLPGPPRHRRGRLRRGDPARHPQRPSAAQPLRRLVGRAQLRP